MSIAAHGAPSGVFVLAGLVSTNGTGLLVVMVVAWVVFWGAFAGLVFGGWHRPSQWWLCTGLVGPLAPLAALVTATVISRRGRARDV